MINLLPTDMKLEITAGRANIIIVRYIFMTLAALVFLAAAVGVAYATIASTEQSAKNILSENEKNTQQYASVKVAADDFRSKLTVAKQILDKEVSYSKLMLAIAGSLPKGMVISTLQLDSKTLGTPTTLIVNAKTKTDALTLKTALQKQTALFSDVKLVSVTESAASGTYPVVITVSLIINKGTT